MKIVFRNMFLIVFTAQVALSQLLPNLGGQRVGISSLQFLKIGVGARGTGMGEATVAVATGASALFWNPAGIATTPENEVLAAYSAYVVDLHHQFFGITYHLSIDDVVGISCLSLQTDDMPVTTETRPFGTGEYFRYSDLAVGITYARKMTTQFNFGITLKYAEENLASLKIQTLLFDLGTYYHTGVGSLRIGVAMTNFGSDVAPKGTVTLFDGTTTSSFQSFSPPTMFKVGVAYDVFTINEHILTVALQLNHPNDNAEHLRCGVEYNWNSWLYARVGLKRTIGTSLLSKDQTGAENYSFGLGIRIPMTLTVLTFDYSYTDYNLLGNIHRISCGFTY
ncbi:MAG: PorV/PorQ family protein [Bacteroidetes bacterium]|nr:PorV/PorQ family protein [Bacteroidota bacterium]